MLWCFQLLGVFSTLACLPLYALANSRKTLMQLTVKSQKPALVHVGKAFMLGLE